VLAIKLLNSSSPTIIDQTLTNLTIHQATFNLIPILSTGHPFLQPMRVIPKPVLLIPFPGQSLTGTLVCDDKSEDGDEEEG